jgi:diguanylate cyclase (GGDEF)-like protein
MLTGMEVLDRRLARLSRAAIVAISGAAVALIGVLDWVTGYEVSFGVFYLAPVAVTTWYASRRTGFAFAVGSSFVWYAAEIAAGYPYDHPLIPVWNAFVRLSFFLITATLMAAVRLRLDAERLLATTDGLTGLLNSRAFRERLEQQLAIAQRTGRPFTLVYVDLDDFKRINDTYGHGEGDRQLRAVGRVLVDETRKTDSVARLGGDEFALILPDTDRSGAETVTGKLAPLLRRATIGVAAPLTCSVGAVVFREPPRNADEAIAAADRLMYDAKSRGKDAAVLRVHPVEAAAEPDTAAMPVLAGADR